MKRFLLPLLLIPAPAAAQVHGFLDAGSGTMRTGNDAESGIIRFAPSFSLSSSRFDLAVSGDYAGRTERGWQTTGELTGGFRLARVAGVSIRGGAEGGWSRTTWGRGAGAWLADLRAEVRSGTSGGSLALATGHSFTAEGAHPITRLETGGWGRIGRVDLGFLLRRVGQTAPGRNGEDLGVGPIADTLAAGGRNQRRLEDHYTDLEATIGWSGGSLALEGGAGRRIGRSLQATSWYLRALYQLSDRLALVAVSGSQPADLVTGLPSGRFTTLSMRVNLRNDSPSPSFRPAPDRHDAFMAEPDGSGLTTIAVRVPGAQTVELMGDFTSWTPVPLVPDGDDSWRLRMRIGPGVHEVNIRVNGGAWQVPPGLPAADDGLGTVSGRFRL